MSQNPFSNPYDLPEAVVPERTSVLAVMSLVFGIVCVPFFGIIAAFLGVMALFGIKASRGRVSGTGLAVTGIVLGAVFSLVWGGCVGTLGFALQIVTKQVAPDVGAAITSAQQSDVEGVRSKLATPGQQRLTQEAVDQFGAALTSELGEFRGVPGTIGGLMGAYMDVFQAIGQGGNVNPAGNYQNAVPIPVQFENGWAMAFIVQSPPGQGSSTKPMPFDNIIILTPGGAEIVLIPFGTTLPAPSPAPALPDPAPESGSDTGQDSDPESGDN
ncbi:MAG: DUF4190 domain-containing protein [Phycisphaeraceae bacterium]|nr:DUF4190 domain-containing protein [Phycisphaeraceae bacterium]QYK48662.1 MAG: DUF4190 domain-containing protein [Phycisphaeraceae bacterium]